MTCGHPGCHATATHWVLHHPSYVAYHCDEHAYVAYHCDEHAPDDALPLARITGIGRPGDTPPGGPTVAPTPEETARG